MTRRRTAVLLASCLAALAVPPASADGPAPAATTSFLLRTSEGEREVALVAAREDGGDVLLVRIDDCAPRGCLSDEVVLPLQDGQLELSDEKAELTVLLDGRPLRATWVLDEGALQVSGGRLRSEGPAGQTAATSFAGRGAHVQVVLGGERCATTGALGAGVRFATRPMDGQVSLGAGVLHCDTAADQDRGRRR